MGKKISAHVIALVCVLFIAGVAAPASAGTKGANFKVPARGTIEYTVDVPQNAGSISIKVTDQSQNLNLEVFQPEKDFVSCRTTTWTSSIGLDNPLQCSFNKPKPGAWKVKVTGSVHVSNVDKYPFVTGQLTVNTRSGQPGLSGPGVQASAGQPGGVSATKGEQFKVPARGVRDFTVDVPPNTKTIYFTVKDQSQHLTLEVFQPEKDFVSCRTTTWTSSIGLDNPLQCSFNKPKPGAWKVKVTGSVHVSNVDKYPFVTGQLIVKMIGDQATPPSAQPQETAWEDETPPGHPKVEVPQGPSGTPAPVPEAGTWFPSSVTLEYDSHLKGYIKKSDYDMYKFYFPGGNLRAYSNGNLDLVADLLNEKQERVARDRSSGSGNNFMFQGNYPAGLYYIQIRVMYHGGEGPYELILGNGQDWSFVESN